MYSRSRAGCQKSRYAVYTCFYVFQGSLCVVFTCFSCFSTPRAPLEPPGGPTEAQQGPRKAHRAPKRPPRGSPERPRLSPETPRGPTEAHRHPAETRRGPQCPSRGPTEAQRRPTDAQPRSRRGPQWPTQFQQGRPGTQFIRGFKCFHVFSRESHFTHIRGPWGLPGLRLYMFLLAF